MNKSLKSALKQSFTPPPAQHREQFINNIPYPKATFGEVLISQIGFIRKRVWILFLLSVCFAFFYAQFVKVPENIVAGVSAILPFFSLCTVAEVYRSTACNMEELELACKYNLTKIMLMRIGILGTASFILLALLVAIVGRSDFGTFRNVIYISVPYLFSSYLSLLIIARIRSKETMYVCAVINGAVSITMMLTASSYRFVYNTGFTFIWVTLFVIFFGFFFYSLIRFTKSQEELQWKLL